MTTIIARSAESVHWYKQDGAPQYTVKANDGSDRPTTLRDARKMNLVPSVTTILKVAAKPALEAWKMEQMLLAALTLPRLDNESEKGLIDRIVADSKETAKKAANRGTDIHESIEKWMKGDGDVKHVRISFAFDDAVSDYFKTPKTRGEGWITEASFAEMGFGGKVDLHRKPDAFAPDGIVLDTKTKEFSKGDKVVAYEEQLMQLAAYRYGLGMPKARCANVFVSASEAGTIHIHEWTDDELRRGWEMFQCLHNFWKLKNLFNV